MSNAQKRSSAKKRTQAGGQQASPWPKRFVTAAGVGVVLALAAAVFFSSSPVRGIPEGTKTVAVDAPLHVDEDIYADDEVPAGGNMNSIWLNCGFYDTLVPAENAVHSLEHGAVWITHQPDIPSEQIDQFRQFTGAFSKVIVSPVPGLSSPILMTAWGFQLELSNADDARLEQFVNEFAGSLEAPEPGGTCGGGVGVPVG
ncbi:MAG: hypothetical protein BMS9Abin07_1580 [Acidimicrobiia bacterium]|nr:MAG: hypothetical protein BMS9Abin07_1580 [Acidimicrobiia bacterium]